jgi:hypothetical protein
MPPGHYGTGDTGTEKVQEVIGMKENDSGKYSGIGFTGILQLAFIILKLLKIVDWPWVLIFAPVLIIIGLIVLIMVILEIVFLISDRDKMNR